MEAVLANLKEWFQDRKQHLDLFDETKTGKQDNPLYILGDLVWLSWMAVIVSGIVLMLWYIPTTTGAYRSIQHITLDLPFGWLVRGIHKYGGDMLITVIFCTPPKSSSASVMAVSVLPVPLGPTSMNTPTAIANSMAKNDSSSVAGNRVRNSPSTLRWEDSDTPKSPWARRKM